MRGRRYVVSKETKGSGASGADFYLWDGCHISQPHCKPAPFCATVLILDGTQSSWRSLWKTELTKAQAAGHSALTGCWAYLWLTPSWS